MPYLPDLTSLLPGRASTTTTASEASPAGPSHTAFRLAEKHFKNRFNPLKLPSLRNRPVPVLDLSRPARQEDDEVWKAGWWSPENEPESRPRRGKGKARELGERPAQDFEGLERIELNDGRTGWIVAEGCVLIPGYLSVDAQLNLAKAALAEYTLPPNPLSLSTHYALPPNLFKMYAEDSNELVLPLHATRTDSSTDGAPMKEEAPKDDQPKAKCTGRKTVETEPGAVMGYDEIVANNRTAKADAPSDKLKAKTARELLKEIRWANLGWVYLWTTKSYDFTPDVPIPFPSGLAQICTEVVRLIPWRNVFGARTEVDYSSWADDYAPDTGIVNFYQLNDTLMGHVDRAELDPARPLVSISLGHACVFLLGTTSRQDPPRPLILRSGDVLIMSGKGRQFYHGVPRIMEGALPQTFAPVEDDDLVTSAAKRWIASARLNINARQVFPPGFKRPVSGQAA